MTDRKRRLGTTLLLGVENLLTLTSNETTGTKRLMIRITKERTSSRRVTNQRKWTGAGIITRITSRYRMIDACGVTKS